MDLYTWKILSLTLILFVSVLVGLTAYALKKIPSRLTGVFNSFAGGTFLAIALLHLLPEGVEKLQEVKVLPLGFLIALIGYFFILFIDKIAFSNHHLVTHGNRHVDLGVHNHKPGIDEEESRLKHVISTRDRVACHLGTGCGENCTSVCEGLKEPFLDKCNKWHTSYVSSVLLIIALSLHGVLEGFAIGLQENTNDLINLTIAVTIHKIPEILALCISLGDMTQKHSFASVSLLIMASPIGIIMGMLVMRYITNFMIGMLLSFTTGTFLYISASEIVVEEFAISKNKGAKFGSLMLGATVITLMLFLEEHE